MGMVQLIDKSQVSTHVSAYSKDKRRRSHTVTFHGITPKRLVDLLKSEQFRRLVNEFDAHPAHDHAPAESE